MRFLLSISYQRRPIIILNYWSVLMVNQWWFHICPNFSRWRCCHSLQRGLYLLIICDSGINRILNLCCGRIPLLCLIRNGCFIVIASLCHICDLIKFRRYHWQFPIYNLYPVWISCSNTFFLFLFAIRFHCKLRRRSRSKLYHVLCGHVDWWLIQYGLRFKVCFEIPKFPLLFQPQVYF